MQGMEDSRRIRKVYLSFLVSWRKPNHDDTAPSTCGQGRARRAEGNGTNEGSNVAPLPAMLHGVAQSRCGVMRGCEGHGSRLLQEASPYKIIPTKWHQNGLISKGDEYLAGIRREVYSSKGGQCAKGADGLNQLF
eukprot:581690-Pleurochrysis_carterae.AAC.1